MEKTIKKEKKIDILTLWRSFVNSAKEELSQEELILNDTTLSEEDKKELLQSLNKNEKLISKMFKTSYKVSDLDQTGDIPKVKINERKRASRKIEKEENQKEI